MVAYSFKLRFVPNIQAGLGLPVMGKIEQKRQTIRAPRKRHVIAEEKIQLYYAMRTKQCQIIGEATCVDVTPITLTFTPNCQKDSVDCVSGTLTVQGHLDKFAQMDGFIDWLELRSFWASNHPSIDRFSGVLIRWKPITAAASPTHPSAFAG